MSGYDVLSPDRQFYTINELMDAGLTHYKINKLVSEGKLKKINNKTYENTGFNGDTSDFAVVKAYIPRGVFCMMTAARFYGLTTFLPDAVDIAIDRDMKVSTMPEWPDVNIWYFPRKRYESGIMVNEDEAGEFPMYDVEKTVVDILYYRNKVGIEETKEILKAYLSHSDRDLIKLHRYADELGCKKILGTYLEVLI